MSHLSGNPCSFSNIVGTIPDTCSYALTREFHLKDHLGNVRVVFNTSGILSENHYYPFGLPIHNLSTSTAPAGKENRYLYNGKELQDDLGLNWMDYGARFYDAGLGRWHSVDPLAEAREWLSPYNYVQNNPISRTDPDGRIDTDYGLKSNGEITRIGPINNEPDRLFAINNDGSKKSENFLQLENGSISNVLKGTHVYWDEINRQKTSIPFYSVFVKGDSNAEKLFRFLSGNSDVEFGRFHIGTPNNESGWNVLSTSKQNGSEVGSAAVARIIIKNSIPLRGHDHGHPGKEAISIPSGMFFREGGKPGDIQFAEVIEQYYPNVFFRIYTPANKKYHYYNSFGPTIAPITVKPQ